ncbi:MAG TPA: F0F1 ATP synthase subunit delta [Microbacteriaceae bacterium]|nr:F0F1 ATP synthase subunit delta [Microbacteriaceae bacterium]
MGSATTQSLATARGQLGAAKSVGLETAQQLFDVAGVVGGSTALLAALTSFDTDSAPKVALVKQLFGSLGSTERALVEGLVTSRWSDSADLLAALEELGIRAAASSAHVDIDGELLAFERAVQSDHELELALGSKLSPTPAKLVAVDALLGKKAAPATVAVVRQLVSQPRGRRIGEMLRSAAEIAADEKGYALAHVSTANALSDPQRERLEQTLTARAGRKVRLNVVVDAALIGGLKVQIGDDVIDGSIAARLGDLRLKLVG